MERLAKELGNRIHTAAKVRRILHQKGKVVGVLLQADGEYPCQTVVLNVGWPQTMIELLGEARPRILMSPSVLTFYWVVPKRPSGLGHHTIFLPADFRAAFDELLHGERVPAGPAFYVAAPPPQQPGSGSEERCGVLVLVPLPVTARIRGTDWADLTGRVKQFVLTRLQQAGVGLTNQSILWEEAWTPRDWQRRFGLFEGSAFGAAHTLSQLGPFRPRNYSRRIRGLYFVGASTTPATGLPLVARSGRLTAERIRSHVR